VRSISTRDSPDATCSASSSCRASQVSAWLPRSRRVWRSVAIASTARWLSRSTLVQPLGHLGQLVGDPGQAAVALLAAAHQRLGLRLGLGLIGARVGDEAAGAVEARLRRRQLLLGRGRGLGGRGHRRLAGGHLGGQALELGLARRQLDAAVGPLRQQALALGGLLDGALVELAGLAGLEADLRLGQAHPVVELVELLLQGSRRGAPRAPARRARRSPRCP
jgi:hypothetical protein